MVNTKNAFWQALIITIIIFIAGILIGVSFEMYRTNNIESTLLTSESSLLDQQMRDIVITNLNISCGNSVNDTFSFADKIYAEALQLEQYDQTSNFQSTLPLLHQRYDLLRLQLWIESISLKKECNSNFHTVVYLYAYEPKTVAMQAQEDTYSKVLTEVKANSPEEVLLIPIATNLGLDSVTLTTQAYNITSYPAIIIDEKTVITGDITVPQIERAIFQP